MNQEQSERSALLSIRSWGEDLAVKFATSKPIPDEIYFGHAKIFRGCMEYIYNHKWTRKWMSNPTGRAYFCIRLMSLWVTCAKHTGIIDINYLYSKDGALLLKRLMLDLLLPEMEIEPGEELNGHWEDIIRNIRLLGRS